MSSDYGDFCREQREAKQAKNAQKFTESLTAIEASGIAYKRHNGYSHLVFGEGKDAIDFWPSSQLWIQRKTGKRRQGVATLIKHLQVKP